MKNKIVIIAIIILVFVPVFLIAQPLPYDPGIGGGAGSAPVGGGAPLGEGLIMLIVMSIGYGVKKVGNFWRANKNL